MGLFSRILKGKTSSDSVAQGNDEPGHILTINVGSSSIKFTLFEAVGSEKRILNGVIEKIGLEGTSFSVAGNDPKDNLSNLVEAADHKAAAGLLVQWLKGRLPADKLSGIGHRVVHGGSKFNQPVLITDAVVADLKRLINFDPEHLNNELQLIQTLGELFPSIKQVACFDTTFHHDLPLTARLLPIPRRYEAMGIRRFGFHGLSYGYVTRQLELLVDGQKATGKVVIAHLGSGVSLAAVRNGQSIDTTMGLTPAGGVPMSTRSGDIDPGLAVYLARNENLDANQLNDLFNFKSGLLGMSETSADMKVLLENETSDPKAKDAIDVFCYQLKKTIGSYVAALGGLDTLVFTGGMGENAPKIRARACEGMEFLGIELDGARNDKGEGLISKDSSRVMIRIIPADESVTILSGVQNLLGISTWTPEMREE